MRTPLTHIVVVVALCFLALLESARSDASLRFEQTAEELAFRLSGSADSPPWVLQHSGDGQDWHDLAVLERAKGTDEFSANISRCLLPDPQAESAYFRAVRIEDDDPFLRNYLAALAQWRSSKIASYSYELSWNWSFFSWHGLITVTNGEVTSSEKIMSFPDELEPLALLTIDDWFDRIARARAQNAEIIDITWDPDTGYPAKGFIDLSQLIADEEEGWMIESLQVLPQ